MFYTGAATTTPAARHRPACRQPPHYHAGQAEMVVWLSQPWQVSGRKLAQYCAVMIFRFPFSLKILEIGVNFENT
jgi:hypothetical protein